ncbi:PA14 domain-containing protein [Plesiocystis pacifica]|uniref:PA14 domain-containing protein n=1 Tax=Plesiocystis pacifica TaxID=191768 RepID=UPI000A30BD21|nr:PA14 domain-containing protein [Plesiocystis pacifica]
MTRTTLTLAAVAAFALTGCFKNTSDDSQNPDGVAADGAEDGSGQGDAQTESRARGTTTAVAGGKPARARTTTVQTKKPPRAVPSEPVEPQDDGPNGLMAEAFPASAFGAEALDAMPDFSSATATERFTVPNLDFDEVSFEDGFPGLTVAKENYALRFTGSFNVVEEAEYELCLHSDDGSQLLLEDTLLVDNDGVHDAPVEACELVFLAPGEYSIQINYFQASGPSLALHFAWAMNGGDKAIVPTDVLFKPATDAAGG